MDPLITRIRFIPPGCGISHCQDDKAIRDKIEIEGQNPKTAPNTNERYTVYIYSRSVMVNNSTAELTSLAGKLYWMRVRTVQGLSRDSA